MDDDVDTVLEWIGFDEEDDRNIVADEGGFLHLTDFASLDKDGISALTDSLRKRIPDDQRVHLSKGKQDMLRNIANWAADFARVSLEPELPTDDNDNENQELFESALVLAKHRAEARRYLKDNTKTLSDAAEPKPLKDEKDWFEFVDQFFVYLSAIPGVTGIPLAYVIRAVVDPDHEREWGDDEFNEMMIRCAPLEGPAFVTDSQTVHLLIYTMIESEELLSVIYSTKRRKNGRLDYLALKEYMSGPGNVSRRIGTAKQMKANLHYRGERNMKFTVFLTKLRHMHHIFETEGRPMQEGEKIEDLLDKIKPEAKFLESQKANLESMHVRGELTFKHATNTLASAVANSPQAKLNARISETTTHGPQPAPAGKLRRTKGGAIDTDYSYPDAEYRRLDPKDKNELRLAREKVGKTRGGKKKGGGGGGKDRPIKLSEIKQVVQDVVDSSRDDADDGAADDEDAVTTGDAGTRFAGRNEKKRKRGGKG